ncbi:MAG: hypothetical protein COB39_06900 [Marinosulfonomonas sp.]|nr:MAG: hypothetical protein COB39_06900 [Marinosulfonomonas sp.]
MKRYILATALLASPVFAEVPPWVGIWTADPDWCQYAELIGGHDPAPIRITQTEVSGLENNCSITGVRSNAQKQYWELTLSCSGEGEQYQDTALLMLDGDDTLWRWFGRGDPFKFIRCEG